jgi:hypothetical protein
MKQEKKGVMINLDSNVISILKYLAEKNSSSMSQEVRRLILDERTRQGIDIPKANGTL